MDKIKVLTPMKAMRAKCLDCCLGNYQEVRLCPVRDCALYPYRMGHRPKGEEFILKSDSTQKLPT